MPADQPQISTVPGDEPRSRPPHAVPEQVGPYRVLGRLGEGGMGTVYKAEQRAPVRRTVAVKVIKLGMDTGEVVARFESERQALSRMDHPGIARVLDAGADERGRPYFVMEFVPGVPITTYADREKMPIKERLLLFLQVCDAIAHAHSKAILHRDIKASNVLAFTDGRGNAVAKVIDFGVAKALTSDRLTDRTFNTQMGLAVGTYESMSPEQADGSPDIDARSDVYALGVLLYELLSGAKPLANNMPAGTADAEIRRAIRDVEPPRPSVRLTSLGQEEAGKIAADRRLQLPILAKELKAELEWIPMMCLRKERDRRYASPLLLAADARNYLEGLPLQAGPDTRSYRLGKLMKRSKGPIAAVIAVLLVLLLGIAGTTIGLLREAKERKIADGQRIAANTAKDEAQNQRREADTERKNALAVLDFLTKDVLAQASPRRTRDKNLSDELVKTLIEPALATADARFKDQPLVRAEIQYSIAAVLESMGKHELALTESKAALDTRRSLLGEDHDRTLDSVDQTAFVMIEMGRPRDAAPIAKEVFDRCTHLKGENDHNTLRAGCTYGYALLRQGLHADAAVILKQIMERSQKQFGNEDSCTMSSLNDYALALYFQHNYTAAAGLFKQLLDIDVKLDGEDDPRSISALANYALAVDGRQNHVEALSMFQQVLEKDEKMLGDDNPSTMLAVSNYCNALDAVGQFDEAERRLLALNDKAREICPDDPNRGRFLFNYGGCLMAQNKFADAEQILRECWAYDRKHPDARYPTPRSLTVLNQCLEAMGKPTEHVASTRPGR